MQEEGLKQEEVEKLLEKYGPNEIKDTNKASLLKILLNQIKGNFIIYLLVIAAVISFFVKEVVTTYTISAVILVVITTGFIQEYKAEKAISALKKMIVPITIVIRDGKEQEVQTKDLVPGDILLLKNGEKIPADCVILNENELFVDESVLTGESREVKKYSVNAKDERNYEDKNLLFMGSFIVGGKCTAKIISTGMKTKFGKIAGLISSAEKELLLQKKINHISKYLAIMAVSVSLITGIAILFQSQISTKVIIEILILVIAIAVSAFPEGFPVVLITTLSLGAYRMAQKNAIVNRMSIIETLGETTVICSDKTGTITKGEMTVKQISTSSRNYSLTGIGYEGKGDFLVNGKKIAQKSEKNLQLLLKAGILCNDASITKTSEDDLYHIIGTPTEAALLIAGAKSELFKDNLNFPREEEVPFSSERKMMTVVCKEGKDKIVYSKGALEYLIEKCKYIQKENGVFKLLDIDKKRIIENNSSMTSKALRVIAFAYKKAGVKKDLEKDLIFIGMVGMEDPPREEVKDAIELCRKAGIKVKMITGDNRETAIAIAKEIGLDKGEIMEGSQLDKISDKDLVKVVQQTVIFSRVRPEHKLRIVRALKENGEIVTMTGDGVNDAPALKEAHIGVAMGINGTDVSRSAADLTLKDDNFATIVSAIREGRTIFKNIRKFVTYQLSCNYAELSVLLFGVLLAPIFGWPIPILLALQILFMNLVTDDLPAITLGFNPSSDDIMQEQPRKKSQILNKNLIIAIVVTGSIMAIFTLLVFGIVFNGLDDGVTYARTTALFTLIALEIAGAFIYRSFRKGIFGRSLFVNKYLFLASIISIAATVAIIYTPLNHVFGTSPIDLADWLVAISIALVFIVIYDIFKKINKKKKVWKEE